MEREKDGEKYRGRDESRGRIRSSDRWNERRMERSIEEEM
jgi:hypothetical protein